MSGDLHWVPVTHSPDSDPQPVMVGAGLGVHKPGWAPGVPGSASKVDARPGPHPTPVHQTFLFYKSFH